MLDNFLMTVSIIQRGLQLFKLLLIIVDKTLVHLVCLEIIIMNLARARAGVCLPWPPVGLFLLENNSRNDATALQWQLDD